MKNINQITILSPGGNITVIVQDEVPRKLQPSVAEKIMKIYNANKLIPDQIEQVAFIETPTQKKAIARLQMSGGEFSGNAALCFAFLNKKSLNKSLLEISGTRKLLRAKTFSDGTVACQMPVRQNLKIKYTRENFPLISLEGISHVIVEKQFTKSEKDQKNITNQVIKKNALEKELAVGVMFIKRQKGKISLKPYVYFLKGSTWDVFPETACGSGSIAVGILEFFSLKEEIKDLEIIQPTEASLFVTVTKRNSVINAWIKGKVKVLYQGPFNLG